MNDAIMGMNQLLLRNDAIAAIEAGVKFTFKQGERLLVKVLRKPWGDLEFAIKAPDSNNSMKITIPARCWNLITPSSNGGSTMAVYAYIRVSTDQQKYSLEWQRELIERWAKRVGVTITDDHVFVDEAQSGKIPIAQRPAGKVMMSMLSKGDTLVSYDVTRISRSVPDFCHLMDFCNKLSVHLILLDQGGNPIDPANPYHRMQMQMLAVFSEFFLHMLRAKTKEGVAAAKARGVLFKMPFGVRVVNNGNSSKGKKLRTYKWVKDISRRFICDVICYGATHGYPPDVVLAEIRRINAVRKYVTTEDHSLGFRFSPAGVKVLWSYYRRWPHLVKEACEEYEKIRLTPEEELSVQRLEYCGFSGYSGPMDPQKAKRNMAQPYFKNTDFSKLAETDDSVWTMPEVLEVMKDND